MVKQEEDEEEEEAAAGKVLLHTPRQVSNWLFVCRCARDQANYLRQRHMNINSGRREEGKKR